MPGNGRWRSRGVWTGIRERYLVAYGEGRCRVLTDGELICLPWLKVLSSLYFFVSQMGHSWRRVAVNLHDLQEAEHIASNPDMVASGS